MTIRKTLIALALPAILIGGEAAARPCPYSGCGTESEGAQLGAVTAAKRADESCPDWMCGSNGMRLTGTRAPFAAATIIAIRWPSVSRPGTGCPPFACGSESNGPELTGIRAPSAAVTVIAMQPRPRPNPIVCLLNPSSCKLATNGPELTGARTRSRATTVVAIRLPGQRPPVQAGGSCPPFACGSTSNGPELTGTRAPSAAATITSVRLSSIRRPNGVGGSCPPFACGTDGNGPELTGIVVQRRPQLDPPPPRPRPLPIPYPNGQWR